MKTKKSILSLFVAYAMIGILFSCTQSSINPNQELDDIFIPNGYHQIDNPSSDALARLEELRLENPSNEYFYLTRESKVKPTSKDWIFTQNELKIEYVDHGNNVEPNENPNIHGVIVKKIEGNWAEEVFTIVDDQPVPKAGMGAYYKYISENMKYPAQARKMGIEGRVFIQFVVDANGKFIDVKSVKGIGAGCDEEAVRVVKESPLWNPGMVGDKAGKVRMILPITFKLG